MGRWWLVVTCALVVVVGALAAAETVNPEWMIGTFLDRINNDDDDDEEDNDIDGISKYLAISILYHNICHNSSISRSKDGSFMHAIDAALHDYRY